MNNLPTLERPAERPVPISDPLERLREQFAGVQIWMGGWSREFLAIVRGQMFVARSAAALEQILAALHPSHPGYVRDVGGWVLAGDR
jgi:hypothetical protein